MMAMALSCWRDALGYPSGVTPLNQRDSLGYPGRLNAGDMHWLAHIEPTPLNQRLIRHNTQDNSKIMGTIRYPDKACSFKSPVYLSYLKIARCASISFS